MLRGPSRLSVLTRGGSRIPDVAHHSVLSCLVEHAGCAHTSHADHPSTLWSCLVVLTVRVVRRCRLGTGHSFARGSANVELVHKLLSCNALGRRPSPAVGAGSDHKLEEFDIVLVAAGPPSSFQSFGEESSPCTIISTSMPLLLKHIFRSTGPRVSQQAPRRRRCRTPNSPSSCRSWPAEAATESHGTQTFRRDDDVLVKRRVVEVDTATPYCQAPHLWTNRR